LLAEVLKEVDAMTFGAEHFEPTKRTSTAKEFARTAPTKAPINRYAN
jgi:hypothetical protein